MLVWLLLQVPGYLYFPLPSHLLASQILLNPCIAQFMSCQGPLINAPGQYRKKEGGGEDVLVKYSLPGNFKPVEITNVFGYCCCLLAK